MKIMAEFHAHLGSIKRYLSYLNFPTNKAGDLFFFTVFWAFFPNTTHGIFIIIIIIFLNFFLLAFNLQSVHYIH